MNKTKAIFFCLLVCLSLGVAFFVMRGKEHLRPQSDYVTDLLLPYTPVKDQGHSQLCWAYAMLSTIETTHIAMGDSVHLSPQFVEKRMNALAREGKVPAGCRAMAQTLISFIMNEGICAYDAYHDTVPPTPRYVFMLGAEYTTKEFAHSVCGRHEYEALTSNEDYPYFELVELPLQDNWMHHKQLNVPVDAMVARIDSALARRQGVCWEGGMHGRRTDDHCMAIVGKAHDKSGKRYYIMKNSWGTGRGYEGLEYMAEDYLRKNTVCVVLPRF